jgi:hypothetical protein
MTGSFSDDFGASPTPAWAASEPDVAAAATSPTTGLSGDGAVGRVSDLGPKII